MEQLATEDGLHLMRADPNFDSPWQEKHVEHLARCLTVLQQLIAPGHIARAVVARLHILLSSIDRILCSSGHELAARAVEAGVKASHLELDRLGAASQQCQKK